jgi:hypothetical protein
MRSVVGKFLLGCVAVLICAVPALGAISWDNGGTNVGGNWWFDPANWSQTANSLLPPGQLNTTTMVVDPIDALVSTGVTIDYDPDHDPFYNNAANLQYPAGAVTGPQAGAPTAFGATSIYRLYLTRRDATGFNTTTNTLNIKSGSLWVLNLMPSSAASFIVGRSGNGTGKIVQTSGFVSMAENLDVGSSEAVNGDIPATGGTGIYDYRGGTVEAGINTTATGRGIRLSAGVVGAPSGAGTFINRSQGNTGHIRVQDFVFASVQSGVGVAVATAEFHYTSATGNVRPIQVNRNLSINNSIKQSSRLNIVLDQVPALDDLGVPKSIGLFDVDSDGNGVGQLNSIGDGDSARRYFYSKLGNIPYTEGSTVSSVIGLTRYNWTIHYNGNISWSDIDNSVVSSIDWVSGGLTRDVVLIGLSTSSAILHNDLNFDGMVDSFDIPDLLKALTDLNAYKTQHSIPDNATLNQIADVNNDGFVNNGDIQSLLGLFEGTGSIAAVPEPASCVLVVLGCCGLAMLRRRRR